MKVGFRDADVQRLFNERRRLAAKYGEGNAQVIACRMMVLQAAPKLGLLPQQPPVNLQATNQMDVFTIDAHPGQRLQFAIYDRKYDKRGLLLWWNATEVDVLGVVS